MLYSIRFQGGFSRVLMLGTALATAAATGCADDGPDGFSQEDWKLIKQIQPLSAPPPVNPFNVPGAQEDLIAELGQLLFFDKEVAEGITVTGPSGMMGETGKVACVTCHDNKYFADSRSMYRVSHGRTWLGRQTGPMVNLAYYDWTLSTGRFDSMVDHGAGVWGTSATPLAYSRFLYKKYKAQYQAAFPNDPPLDERLGLDPADPYSVYPATGGPKASPTAANGPFEMMPADAQLQIHRIRANLGRVFDTYPRKLTTPDSPFELYVRDEKSDALTSAAKRGLKLFIGKAACNDCHNGPILSDNKFHNVAVPDPTSVPGSTTPPAPDRGRGSVINTILTGLKWLEEQPAILPPVFNGASMFSDNRERGMVKMNEIREIEALRCQARDPMTSVCSAFDHGIDGTFRTLSLLNIAETAPYFHTGEAKTLEEVVRHYNKGGGEIGSFVGTKSPRLRPLGLTDDEIADLVEFLKSLTGVAPAENEAHPEIQRWAMPIKLNAAP